VGRVRHRSFLPVVFLCVVAAARSLSSPTESMSSRRWKPLVLRGSEPRVDIELGSMEECRMTPIRLEQDGGLAVATLDSPPLNLFDSAMFDALAGVVATLEDEPPRALLVRAGGKGGP